MGRVCARATLAETEGEGMPAIDVTRRSQLTHLVGEFRVAARTVRSQTLAERRETCTTLAASLRERLETHAAADEPGLEALGVWADSLEHADVKDVDLLQELLYGIDTLVRCHLWRETGVPLEPPLAKQSGDV